MEHVPFDVLPSPGEAGSGLGDRAIHVWQARLDLPYESVARLERALTVAERGRIGALRSEVDRRRATTSRGLQRYILAGYAGGSAPDLRFGRGPGGKPEIESDSGDRPLHFNASHSGELLLVAVARAPCLGVDVERIRAVPRAERVGRRAFTESERRRIRDLPHEQRTESFITCWTRKEACVKALGEGVWSAFDRFEVTVDPRRAAEIVAVDGDRQAATEWSLYDLRPASGYVGALAVKGTDRDVSGGTFDPSEVRA